MIRPRAFVPKYIRPESINLGQLIRISWKEKDVEHSVTARPAKRDHETFGTVYTTAEGVKLLTLWRAGSCTPQGARITTLEPAPDYTKAQLF